jgi:hypothetical protein
MLVRHSVQRSDVAGGDRERVIGAERFERSVEQHRAAEWSIREMEDHAGGRSHRKAFLVVLSGFVDTRIGETGAGETLIGAAPAASPSGRREAPASPTRRIRR